MAIRVDRDVFDAVGAGAQLGGLRFYEDGTRQPPWQPRPFMSTTEVIVSNAMRMMSVPAEEILATVRPPMPAGGLFQQEFGYDPTQPTIEDVLGMNRRAGRRPNPRMVDYQEDMWSGTTRNAMPSSNPMG